MRLSLIAVGLAVLVVACAGPRSGNGTTATTAPQAGTTSRATETTVAPSETTTTAAVDLVAQGESLAARNGCTACHSADGSPLTGPTWQGLYGSEETLDNGSTVIVDDAYIQESIIDPNAKIVDGYTANVMPADFGDRLSDDDIAAIVAYIKSLG